MAATVSVFTQPVREPLVNQDDSEVFEEWFSHCRGLLYETACRVLGGPEGANLAVQNCWLGASRNTPEFDCKGAFCSWLLRVVINEALAIVRHRRRAA